MSLKFKIDGMESVHAAFENIKESVRKRITRKGMTKIGRHLVKAAKARMSFKNRTKAMRKAFGYKVTTNQKSVTVRVAPRAGYKTTWTSPSGRTWPVNPVYYFHLLELGTKRSKAFPFAGPTWAAEKNKCKQILMDEIAAEIKKLNSKV